MAAPVVIDRNVPGWYMAECDDEEGCLWYEQRSSLDLADKAAAKHAKETGHPVLVWRLMHDVGRGDDD